MREQKTAVFGIFRVNSAVKCGLEALRAAGFRNRDVSLLIPANQGTKDSAHHGDTRAPEGATAGAASGAVTDGVLGWLAGVGTLATPGIGPLLAAGPMLAMLTGVGDDGVAGGIVGSLIGMGVPDYEAKRYEGRIRDGGILLSVHCDSSDWVRHAKNILGRTGAEDVSSAGEAVSADYTVSDWPVSRI